MKGLCISLSQFLVWRLFFPRPFPLKLQILGLYPCVGNYTIRSPDSPAFGCGPNATTGSCAPTSCRQYITGIHRLPSSVSASPVYILSSVSWYILLAPFLWRTLMNTPLPFSYHLHGLWSSAANENPTVYLPCLKYLSLVLPRSATGFSAGTGNEFILHVSLSLSNCFFNNAKFQDSLGPGFFIWDSVVSSAYSPHHTLCLVSRNC